jgi:putative DNA primase/helicase
VAEIICHNNPTPRVEEEPPWSEVSIERIEAALEAIDPDMERKPWIAVGCALYKQLGDSGFHLWDEWSRKGAKYNEREMKGQWKGITKKGGYAYSIGTLFYYASEADPDWDWEVES